MSNEDFETKQTAAIDLEKFQVTALPVESPLQTMTLEIHITEPKSMHSPSEETPTSQQSVTPPVPAPRRRLSPSPRRSDQILSQKDSVAIDDEDIKSPEGLNTRGLPMERVKPPTPAKRSNKRRSPAAENLDEITSVAEKEANNDGFYTKLQQQQPPVMEQTIRDGVDVDNQASDPAGSEFEYKRPSVTVVAQVHHPDAFVPTEPSTEARIKGFNGSAQPNDSIRKDCIQAMEALLEAPGRDLPARPTVASTSTSGQSDYSEIQKASLDQFIENQVEESKVNVETQSSKEKDAVGKVQNDYESTQLSLSTNFSKESNTVTSIATMEIIQKSESESISDRFTPQGQNAESHTVTQQLEELSETAVEKDLSSVQEVLLEEVQDNEKVHNQRVNDVLTELSVSTVAQAMTIDGPKYNSSPRQIYTPMTATQLLSTDVHSEPISTPRKQDLSTAFVTHNHLPTLTRAAVRQDQISYTIEVETRQKEIDGNQVTRGRQKNGEPEALSLSQTSLQEGHSRLQQSVKAESVVQGKPHPIAGENRKTYSRKRLLGQIRRMLDEAPSDNFICSQPELEKKLAETCATLMRLQQRRSYFPSSGAGAVLEEYKDLILRARAARTDTDQSAHSTVTAELTSLARQDDRHVLSAILFNDLRNMNLPLRAVATLLY